MKGKLLYIISTIVIALPWIFLSEVLPIPYHRISTLAEIIIQCTMFAGLLIVVSLLRKELKRMKAARIDNKDSDKKYVDRMVGRLLFLCASITIFVVGLTLLFIGISYSL